MNFKYIAALALAALVISPATAEAKVQHKLVSYSEGGQQLEGYMAWDDAKTGKRPGVMVVHEWWGMNDYVQHRADQLAKLGYVAFAADMYGKGKHTTDAGQAKAWAGPFYGDTAKWRSRAKAGWDQLAANPNVDPTRMAAMGYCFGGGTALELARSGVAMRGVVSFHGSLSTPHPETSAFKGKVLVLHGAEDPNVPMKDVLAFEDEMRSHKTNYEVVLYGGAVHAFSNPKANMPANGVAYNEQADKRSWQEMRRFFTEIFAK